MSEAQKLISWYNQQSYDFPWRQNINPYNIWISEIMLQQTQVKTVIPYYMNWMKHYPDIETLQKADINKLLYLWQGLGYYSRAKNIHNAANIIFKKFNNKFPDNYKELITLPGIGDYTASMILSICFKKYDYVPVDGNIKRIMSRVNVLSLKQETLQNYKKFTRNYIDKEKPGDSIQALMDIGREICTPKLPKCDCCPIYKNCKAHMQGTMENYPVRKKKKHIPHYDIAVALIWKENKFLISKRPQDKLLGNLWELPGGKLENRESLKQCLKREIKEELDIKIKKIKKIGLIKHQYSHMKLTITLFTCIHHSGKAKPLASQEVRWITMKEKKSFAFPRATHKLFELL